MVCASACHHDDKKTKEDASPHWYSQISTSTPDRMMALRLRPDIIYFPLVTISAGTFIISVAIFAFRVLGMVRTLRSS